MKKDKEEEKVIKTDAQHDEWEKTVTDRQWDDFLAWCKEQENCTHE